MSDQEAPFNDPEQQLPHPPSSDQHNVNYDPREQSAYYPQNPQPRNVDPRKQPRWQAPPQQQQEYMRSGPYPYTSPYTGSGPQQMAPGQYGPQLQKRRRRGPLACLITLLVIVVILVVLVGGALGLLFSGVGSNTVTETHTYSVTGTPTLVINDDVGTINVHTGSGNSIIVQATKHTNNIWGKPGDAQVSYLQSGSTITVNATIHSGISFFSGEHVDLDITAPSSDVLQLKTQTGTIDVTGISGRMSLMTNTGAITANQDMLAGPSILHTNTGSVTFNGSIDTSGGSYLFETNTGSVDVTLPSDSSFHMVASSTTGSINSDFPVNVQHSGASSTANGDVGSSPQATVTLHTDTGSISLHKA